MQSDTSTPEGMVHGKAVLIKTPVTLLDAQVSREKYSLENAASVIIEM